jgi:hypothetical protein
MLGPLRRWFYVTRELALDARARVWDLLDRYEQLRDDWQYDVEDTHLYRSRSDRRRVFEQQRHRRWQQSLAKAAEPPPSSAATEFLLATLKPGQSVRLTNGETHEVLEPPYVRDGWQMVKVAPRHAPREGTTDPQFLLVPLTMVDIVIRPESPQL